MRLKFPRSKALLNFELCYWTFVLNNSPNLTTRNVDEEIPPGKRSADAALPVCGHRLYCGSIPAGSTQ
jgi:hypothetical protein